MYYVVHIHREVEFEDVVEAESEEEAIGMAQAGANWEVVLDEQITCSILHEAEVVD